MYTGIVEDFERTWGSGIGILVLKDGTRIPCENGPTVRALEACYPGFITDGHVVDVEAIKGQSIQYELTDWGTLAWLLPDGFSEETERSPFELPL